VPLDHPIREMALRYLQLAEELPENEALIYEIPPFVGRRLTWSDIANRSDDLLRHYRGQGVRSDSRCAVTLAHHLDLIPGLLALWRLDAMAVFVDAAWGNGLRTNVIDHSGANFALDMSGDLQIVRIRDSNEFQNPLPEGTAMMGYTSGSTGDPKGIPFTHTKLALGMHYEAAAVTALHGSTPKRIGCSTRLSGSGLLNLTYSWAPFLDGAVVILPEITITSARTYWRRSDEHEVDLTFLFPAQVEILNQLALPRSPERTATLCLTGSAPVSARLQQRFKERFGLQLINTYGMSEAPSIVTFGDFDKDGNATNDVGVPWMLQARLVDSDGVTVVGSGEGEMQLSGPTLLDYYYGNPAATAAAFDGRWFRTGDILRRNSAGIYKLVGRSKHVVMKGGFSVYLNEVEEAALAISDVIEAAAVPLIQDELEDIGLLIRLSPESTITSNDVHQAVRDYLGIQRAPRRVICISSPLPRLGVSKLDRRAIQEVWESETNQLSADAHS
jgi:long-chain acyl-CoA synthetase